MAQRVPFPIARRQGEAKSKFISSQTMCNAFLEQDPESGDFAVYKAPGLASFCAIGGQGIRGLHDFNGVLLCVSGTTLYTVNQAGTATAQGSIPGSNFVIISDNGAQAVIVVPDVSAYVWDGTTLAQITDPDFQIPSSVDFLDQYMLFSKSNSGAFFLSDIADATSYDALEIASAEGRPDDLVRVIVQNQEALLFGTKTIEGWRDVADPDFPLVKDQTFAEVGLIGVYAVTIIDNSVAWIDQTKKVRILRSGSPQVISDAWVCAEIERWSDASLTVASSYSFRGHEYLVLRNPDGCLVWDASLPAAVAWSEKKSYDMATWRVACCETMVGWGGAVIMGDADTGELYRLDADTYDENGEPLVWQLTSRTMSPGGSPFIVNAIELETEVGVSTVTGQGSDATIWLEVSRDGGYSYGARLERALGAAGNRTKPRIFFRRLGRFPPHGGVIRLSGSDPVPNVLSKAWADIEVLAA